MIEGDNTLKHRRNSISIIVPVVNEEGNVADLIKRTSATLKEKDIEFELIFIDDHSTDSTIKIVDNFKKTYPIKLFTKKGKKGKAYSLIEGFSHAKYPNLAIIDADLQYPPEAIPEMIKKLKGRVGIVVANRKAKHTNFLRKSLSFGFMFSFAKVLHGLNCDVQSGLKVFKKEIIEKIKLNPGPWSFDLEFLLKAKNAGYGIDQVNIDFEKRTEGKSKINIFSAILELGMSAFKLKFRSPDIIPFTKEEEIKKGKGFYYKGIAFSHHSDLHPKESAVKVFMGKQKIILIGILLLFVIFIVLDWQVALISLTALVTFIYFIDLFFNLFLVFRGFSKTPEITISKNDLDRLEEPNLPRYTILCPLYHEWEVLPQFVNAISKLDYPKDKLQVILLLEEDDKETISHARNFNLEPYFNIVVVPDSLPKTKPKALNYGLKIATGDYVVVYDAEDIPDPNQLKKAILAFKKAKPNTVCLQAKLNFYNPYQNILTRVFTAEYSLWFDLILTGLQSIIAPIPLGGTSNHFKKENLVSLHGWDAFNVTEDCDLGMRLVKKGYQTALFNSLTLEEANSHLKNWLNQRTRWIKGYLQTYLVHMRSPKELFKDWREPHLLTFQLIVGGKILSMFINPFMWLTTILYFAFRSSLGVFISQFFPAPVLYMGVFSLVFGNFLYMYYYMVGCAKRKHFELIKFVFLVPFYWLFMSFAAWKAVIQLIRRPHFWPKTIHGFHLDKKKAFLQSPEYSDKLAYTQVLKRLEEGSKINNEYSFGILFSILKNKLKSSVSKLEENKTWNLKTISSGSFLVFAMMFANFLNFLFNAVLGRVLTFTDFGLLTLINAFIYISSIFTDSLSGTVTHRVAFLSSRKNDQYSKIFFKSIFKKSFYIGFFLSFIWIIASPFLSRYFQINSVITILIFVPVILFGLLGSIASGYLRGSFAFFTLGLITMFSPLAKFIVGLGLVIFGANQYAYLSLITTIIFSSILGFFVVMPILRSKNHKSKPYVKKLPRRFFIFNIINNFSTTLFLSVDILLTKHYLSATDAGRYAFLALTGKMIFFFGSLLNSFIFPFVGRDEGLNMSTKPTFKRILLGGIILTSILYIFVGIFGNFTVPLLFGSKAYSILPYLRLYGSAMVIFTISNIFLGYHVAKKQYFVPVLSILVSGLLTLGIILSHQTIQSIVWVIFLASVLRLLVMVVCHRYSVELNFAVRNFNDFLDAFRHKRIAVDQKAFAKRILIFNWRDTKHAYAGGAEVYVHELAKRWVNKGYEVTIFCGNDGHALRYEMKDGIEIFRRGGFYFVYAWAFLYYFIKFRGKYSIIVDCENGIPFFTPLYAKEKIYLLIHHVHQEIFLRGLKPPLSWLALFLELKLMPAVYKNIQTITVSDSSKKDILEKKLTSVEPVVIHNGVDLNIFKPGKKSFTPTVLYLGRLKFYKSLHIFIQAAKLILEKIPDVKFIIAGDGEEKKKLMQLAKKLNLVDKISFLGKVSEQEKISLYQKAWVFVNPSMMEGWGITTIEANACGTPVVASDVHGLRDSVRNPTSGYLVHYGHIDEFVRRIIQIITDSKLRKKLSNGAINWANQFDWQKSADKSLGLF